MIGRALPFWSLPLRTTRCGCYSGVQGRSFETDSATMPTVDRAPEQLCRLAYKRYSQGDLDGLLELFAPEVEVYVAPPNFESGTYCGHSEYRGLLERWAQEWDEMRITP